MNSTLLSLVKQYLKATVFVLVFLVNLSLTGISQNTGNANLNFSKFDSSILKKESRFFLNIHGGYAVGLGSTFKFYPDNISSIVMNQVANNTPTKTTVYSSPVKGLGDGFRFGAGFSYIINDFINLGIDIDYFKSTIHKNRDSTFNRTQIPGGSNSMDSYNYTENTKISYEASLLTFSPNITFKAISKPKWHLYNKLGAVVTFRPSSTQRNSQVLSTQSGWQGFFKDSSVTNKQVYEWGIRNPAFGFMGGVGMQFKVSQKLRIYSELQFSHIVFTVRSRTTTSFVVNDKEMVENLPVNERRIDFSNRFVDVQPTPNATSPSKALTERIPITYIGLQAGVSYRL